MDEYKRLWKIGFQLEKGENFQGALEHYQKSHALLLGKEDASYATYRAKLKINIATVLEKVHKVNFRIFVHCSIFTIIFQLENLEEALECCDKVLDTLLDDRDKLNALLTRGRILSHLGNYEEAIKDLQNAYRIEHSCGIFSNIFKPVINYLDQIYSTVIFDILILYKAYLAQRNARYNFYEILGLKENASVESIAAAAEILILKYNRECNFFQIIPTIQVLYST